MKFGIIKERKTPPDRRVVFSPRKLKEIKQKYPQAEFVIEPSPIRVFPDDAYREAGFTVSSDLSNCAVLLGVKEVPVEALMPNKAYFFFSHTIKKQPYNCDLLRAILEKNINLYDHETVVDATGSRLIGFGRYAGIVGAYNGFRAFGLREKSFGLPKVEKLPDYAAAKEALSQITLPNLKIVLTGEGKVARGAMEILTHLQIKKVPVGDFLAKTYDEAVYCQAEVLDYIKRKDGAPCVKEDFYQHPEKYESDFMKFAKAANFFIAGHFYGDGAPRFFTKDDAKHSDFKIDMVADISCDIDGPVASTLRASTIAAPFYGYDPQTGKEVPFDATGAITVMAVDNLPCELPKDASEGFGDMFYKNVLPAFFNDDKGKVLERAQMTSGGKLTPKFSYLQDFVDGDV